MIDLSYPVSFEYRYLATSLTRYFATSLPRYFATSFNSSRYCIIIFEIPT
jgi:hypothetical protein